MNPFVPDNAQIHLYFSTPIADTVSAFHLLYAREVLRTAMRCLFARLESSSKRHSVMDTFLWGAVLRTTHMTASTTSTSRLFYGWVVLAACFLTTMVASGTMMAFGVFITPLSDDMGWSHSALSFTYALSAIVSGLGVLGVGSLLHTRSLRSILLWGSIVHGFGIYRPARPPRSRRFTCGTALLRPWGAVRFLSRPPH